MRALLEQLSAANRFQAGLQLAIRHPGKVNRLVAASVAYDLRGWQPEFQAAIPQMTVEMIVATFTREHVVALADHVAAAELHRVHADSGGELVRDRPSVPGVLVEREAVADDHDRRSRRKLALELDRERVHRDGSDDPCGLAGDANGRPAQRPPKPVGVTDRHGRHDRNKQMVPDTGEPKIIQKVRGQFASWAAVSLGCFGINVATGLNTPSFGKPLTLGLAALMIVLISVACGAGSDADPMPITWWRYNVVAPMTSADWNYDRAAHLLTHAGFGGTPAEIQKLADLVWRIRPLGMMAVESEVSRALERSDPVADRERVVLLAERQVRSWGVERPVGVGESDVVVPLGRRCAPTGEGRPRAGASGCGRTPG